MKSHGDKAKKDRPSEPGRRVRDATRWKRPGGYAIAVVLVVDDDDAVAYHQPQIYSVGLATRFGPHQVGPRRLPNWITATRLICC